MALHLGLIVAFVAFCVAVSAGCDALSRAILSPISSADRANITMWWNLRSRPDNPFLYAHLLSNSGDVNMRDEIPTYYMGRYRIASCTVGGLSSGVVTIANDIVSIRGDVAPSDNTGALPPVAWQQMILRPEIYAIRGCTFIVAEEATETYSDDGMDNESERVWRMIRLTSLSDGSIGLRVYIGFPLQTRIMTKYGRDQYVTSHNLQRTKRETVYVECDLRLVSLDAASAVNSTPEDHGLLSGPELICNGRR